MSKNFSTAELLVRKGAAVDAQCNKSYQPIHYACETADVDLVQLLLGCGADVEAESKLGKRPLHIATTAGSQLIADLLLAKGASIEARDAAADRPLCLASANGDLDMVQHLLDKGSAMRMKFSSGTAHEDSPLCLAARNGHLSVVQELINRGASIRQRDEQNWQPLRYAAHFGHPNIVEVLLNCGASVSGLALPDSWGFDMTPSRIGFIEGVDENYKARILEVLHQAEAMEQLMQGTSSNLVAPLATLQLDGPAEKADDDIPPGSLPFPQHTLPLPPEAPPTVASIAAIASAVSGAPPAGFHFLAPTLESELRPWPQNWSSGGSGSFLSHPGASAESEFPPSSFSVSPSTPPPPSAPQAGPPSFIMPTPAYLPLSVPQSTQIEQIHALMCDNCKGAGKPMPDLTCPECRRSAFRYSFANEDQSMTASETDLGTPNISRAPTNAYELSSFPARRGPP